jgi:catechol 2,3-dioxygenase-like lactoylglutathione lyase family enzyme
MFARPPVAANTISPHARHTRIGARMAEFVSGKHRDAVPKNRFNLRGIDHVGIPTRDTDLAGKFVERVLGGVEIYRAGYSEEDLKLGRLRHIFYHVGSQLVEVVEQEDSVSYPDKTNPNHVTNPHWAFGATPENLAAFVENLKREGIPFNGPRSHAGTSVVSVYFRDVDGNNLEVTTWDEFPPGLIEVTPMGGKHGFIEWKNLNHSWTGE